MADRRILLVYRSNTPQGLRLGAAMAKGYASDFERLSNEPVIHFEGSHYVEDPYIWHTGDHFEMLAKDWTGMTGEAGLCAEERTLVGDKTAPASLLVPDNERQWGTWLSGYRAQGQAHGLRFKPLHEITEEPYTLYFPIRPGPETAAGSSTRRTVPKRAKKM